MRESNQVNNIFPCIFFLSYYSPFPLICSLKKNKRMNKKEVSFRYYAHAFFLVSRLYLYRSAYCNELLRNIHTLILNSIKFSFRIRLIDPYIHPCFSFLIADVSCFLLFARLQLDFLFYTFILLFIFVSFTTLWKTSIT